MTTTLTDERYITVEDAARHLSVKPATVRHWLRKKKMRGHIVGGDRAGYRIAESEVVRVLRGEPLPETA